MTDLGTLGGISAQAFAVNDRGQVVGTSALANGNVHAVLWNTLNPPTPAEQITALTSAVTTLATAGTVNQGQANALLAKLDAITRQLNKGNKTAAINLLQAFINQVHALVNAGIIPASAGQTLIDAAQKLITELSP
jgi:probable HAF family extracellular repeat protein